MTDDAWYKDVIAAAYDNNIMQGDDNGNISPGGWSSFRINQYGAIGDGHLVGGWTSAASGVLYDTTIADPTDTPLKYGNLLTSGMHAKIGVSSNSRRYIQAHQNEEQTDSNGDMIVPALDEYISKFSGFANSHEYSHAVGGKTGTLWYSQLMRVNGDYLNNNGPNVDDIGVSFDLEAIGNGIRVGVINQVGTDNSDKQKHWGIKYGNLRKPPPLDLCRFFSSTWRWENREYPSIFKVFPPLRGRKKAAQR